tara:strand:- start:215 stop:598 length:384 start_codon:yes stop_codon:yes gene_type:complete
MLSDKKYYSIREVSEMLDIKEHVIRHWDSIDPKTKKLRIENLSIRTNGGTRFFNKSHIKRISKIKDILKENGKRNYSLDLASKFIDQNKKNNNSINKNEKQKSDSSNFDDNYRKIRIITKKLKTLIN